MPSVLMASTSTSTSRLSPTSRYTLEMECQGLTTVRDPFSTVALSFYLQQHPLCDFTTPVVTATSSTTMRLNAVIMINLPVVLLALAAGGSFALPRMADANPWPERREHRDGDDVNIDIGF
ncbi:hypothetical protein BJV77DRAFT_1066343 [Russula vinacea]|nr:hypothetical protein BJV77DRAFT_1066343 [Russula vinacea]